MNMIPLVTLFARRFRLDSLNATFMRQVAWMIQTGNYELSTALVAARFSSPASGVRIQVRQRALPHCVPRTQCTRATRCRAHRPISPCVRPTRPQALVLLNSEPERSNAQGID